MKITKNQLKQIIKEELDTVVQENVAGSFKALGKAVRSVGRDIVPGGLKGEDQDLMDVAMADAETIHTGKRAPIGRNSPIQIFKGGDLYPSEHERAKEALSGMPVKQIYHLILAMNLDSDQVQRVVKHLGPSELAQGVVDAVDGVIKKSSYENDDRALRITMDDFHPNIQTNYAVAKNF